MKLDQRCLDAIKEATGVRLGDSAFKAEDPYRDYGYPISLNAFQLVPESECEFPVHVELNMLGRSARKEKR